MLHANLAYTLPPPTELVKLNYLLLANLENRYFRVVTLSKAAKDELRALGYKYTYSVQTSSYVISW